ncbi:MAG: hypothetical protein ACI4KA_03810 [Oscillospiraceae bacterium]
MKTIAVTGNCGITKILDGTILPGCNIICAEKLSEISADDVPLVIGENAVLPDRLSVLAAVVNCDVYFDLSALKGTAVICCGHSCKNTVSVTSKTSEFITLSLNRSIHTLKGLCDPLEMPLPLLQTVTDDYDYMAAFAASIILGNIG